MKRYHVAVMIAALALAAIALAVPFLISTDLVKQRVADQITGWTGRKVALHGEPVISLFPYLTVKLKDVVVAAAPGTDPEPLVEMSFLKVSIRLLPLFLGRVELAEFTMVQPNIRLIIGTDGKGNWSLDEGTVARRLEHAGEETPGGALAIGEIALGTFVIRDGRLTVEDRRTGRREVLQDIDFDIDWPTTSHSVSAAGTFILRGETVKTNASIGSLADFLARKPVDFRLQLSMAPLRLSLDGSANLVSDLQFEGDLSLSTPSLRRLIGFFAAKVPPGPTLGPLSITGKANAFGGTLSLAEAEIELDGNVAEGVLALGWTGPRPSMQGTLALERLDLTAYAEALAEAVKSGRPDWRGYAIPQDLLNVIDLDMRLSAARILLGRLRLGNTALSAFLRDGRLELEIGETLAYGGRMEGTIKIGGESDQEMAHAKLDVRDLDLRAFFTEIGAGRNLQGKAAFSIDVKSNGRTLEELIDAAVGRARMEITSGALLGIDIARIATDSVEGSGLPTGLGGKTPFARLAADWLIEGGRLITDDLVLSNDDLEVDLGGEVRLLDARCEGSGTVRLLQPGAAGGDRIPRLLLPFTIHGPLSAPILVPDIDRLRKRGEIGHRPGPARRAMAPSPSTAIGNRRRIAAAWSGLQVISGRAARGTPWLRPWSASA